MQEKMYVFHKKQCFFYSDYGRAADFSHYGHSLITVVKTEPAWP